MSPTFKTLPPRTETTRLQERVDRLRASMEWASEAIDAPVREAVHATITRCDERLALGVDHTVVALAGGTGSGKSSLFNALTGTEFAVPGVARPTTAHVSAAVWGEAGALLDWLDVAPERRLAMAGQPGNHGDMEGVVLLDLPDHDSVNEHNRAVVDRVVPLADLLVWVVDPQKYADHALHAAYLTVASDHGQPSLVVLNHVDRLADADADAVAQDLARLVQSQGIEDVPVRLASARTGRGIDGLRAELAEAAASRSVAAEAVRADLVAAGRMLEKALERESDPVLPSADGLIAALGRAAGIEARADAAAAVASGQAKVLPESLGAPVAAVEQIRAEWVDAASAGLPVAWRRVINEAVMAGPALAEELDATLKAMEWPPVVPVTGFMGRLRRAKAAATASRLTLVLGRDAVQRVVTPSVVEPTVMIHQAYRALDELTELD